MALALDYAHSRGVVHRDIKPSNLMIHDAEKVKVTDFGIAKLADAEITHSGALLGTPSYMSPEQAMGERLDGRSDIFSLGVCAFEMLSGLQPFPGANVTSILYKLVHVDPVEPADLEVLGLVPHKWREVFNKVLAKKPENRYQTASDFVRDLEYCLGSWFTGLGEETINLRVPVGDRADGVARRACTRPRAPAGPRTASEPATVLLAPAAAPVPAPPAPESTATMAMLDAPATVLLRPAPRRQRRREPVATPDPEPKQQADVERTVLMAPPPAGPPEAVADDGAGATILMGTPVVPLPPATEQQAVAATEALPVPRPPRAGLPVGLVLGAAAAVLVVLAGLAGLALWRHAQAGTSVERTPLEPTAAPTAAAPATPQPAPTQAAATATGALRVESEPPGARVRVNGETRGQTPLALADLPLGDYDVRLDARGYEGQTRRVALTAGAPAAELRLKLVRAAPVTGSAEIVSTPAGASVTIDGKAVGRTPLAAAALPAGAREVQLVLEGHEPWSGTVDVVAGQKGHVEVRLRPLVAKPLPTPTPEIVDAARVYADTEVDTKPRKVSGNSPSYPSDRAPRLRSGERVSVVLMFVVTESGEVQDIRVMESAGKAIDDVVLSAVKTWRYEPATKRGTKVKVRTAFKQTFLGG